MRKKLQTIWTPTVLPLEEKKGRFSAYIHGIALLTLTYRVNVIPIKIPTTGADVHAEARVSHHPLNI